MEMDGGKEHPPSHLLPKEPGEPDSGEGEVILPEILGWVVKGDIRSQQYQRQELTGDVRGWFS